jgi:hypothetical protein
MYLSPANSSILEANRSKTFYLAPSGRPVLPIESHDLADSSCDRDNLNVFDAADHFEVHHALPIMMISYFTSNLQRHQSGD